VVGLVTMVLEGIVLLTSVVFAVAVVPAHHRQPKARGGHSEMGAQRGVERETRLELATLTLAR
jgi:hypothetical protein